MRTLVTGGTGFLGKNVVRQLLDDGRDLRLLVRKSSDRSGLDEQKIDFAIGDVTDKESVRSAMKGCEVVFHMAALVKSWARDQSLFDKVNVEGFRNVMGCALEEGVGRVIYTSSFMAIGPSDRGVATEETVHDPNHLHNDYERTKYLADRLLPEYVEKGLPVVAVYPGIVYGPGELTEGNIVVDSIIKFLKGKLPGILGDGSKVWCYAFVEDVAKGHLLAAEKGKLGERYILGGENASMLKFLTLLSQITDTPPLKRHIPFWLAKCAARFEELKALMSGKTPETTRATIEVFKHDWAYSSEKAKAELGYTYLSLEEGLRRTVKWIEENGLAEG